MVKHMIDPIADMFSRVKNGYLSKKEFIETPYAKILENIANLLSKEGYVQKIETKKEKSRKKLIITLKYRDKKPTVTNILRVSKPGLKVYVKKDSIPRVLGGIGKVIISTSQGLMTGEEAKKKNIGGEVICKIW